MVYWLPANIWLPFQIVCSTQRTRFWETCLTLKFVYVFEVGIFIRLDKNTILSLNNGSAGVYVLKSYDFVVCVTSIFYFIFCVKHAHFHFFYSHWINVAYFIYIHKFALNNLLSGEFVRVLFFLSLLSLFCIWKQQHLLYTNTACLLCIHMCVYVYAQFSKIHGFHRFTKYTHRYIKIITNTEKKKQLFKKKM